MLKKILVGIIVIILIAISIASASAANYYSNSYYNTPGAMYHGMNVDNWGVGAYRPYASYQYSQPRYVPGPNSVFTQPRNSYNPVGMNMNYQYNRNSYSPFSRQSYGSFGGGLNPSYNAYPRYSGQSRGGAGFSLFGISADFGF